MSQQRDQGKQAQQRRRCALDGPVRPLALGFQAQMRRRFFKGHFEPPTHSEPIQNLQRVSGLVSGKESGRLEFIQRVADYLVG
ncbi:MAG: hypothetical protein KJ069_23245 [Anaerolineae bacterium]|nr:hypothetical protein [Anaerolineae bacterium]